MYDNLETVRIKLSRNVNTTNLFSVFVGFRKELDGWESTNVKPKKKQ